MGSGYPECAQSRLIPQGHDTLAFAQGKGFDEAHLQVHSQESPCVLPFPKSYRAVKLTKGSSQVARKDRLQVEMFFLQAFSNPVAYSRYP